MANIKFSYLYRDAGNNKNFGGVVFENPDNIQVEEVESLIRSKLIDETWFYVNEWLLPDLHFGTWDNEIDHTFHEFESVAYTFESVNSSVSLKEFMLAITKD